MSSPYNEEEILSMLQCEETIKGAFSKIELSYNDATKTLEIGEREGTFEGMIPNRTFNVIFVSANSPKGVDTAAQAVTLKYSGKKLSMKL